MGVTRTLPSSSALDDSSCCRFSISPPGNNHDCYRSWEVLSLGRMPIVKSFPPQDPLWEGLPVVVVENWMQVTAGLLEQKWHEMRSAFYDMDKLGIRWWWLHILKLCLLVP